MGSGKIKFLHRAISCIWRFVLSHSRTRCKRMFCSSLDQYIILHGMGKPFSIDKD